MYPEITCRGFDPPAEFLASIKKEVSRLLDLCPSDSSIETEISSKSGRFEMVMTVNYMGGEFLSRTQGKTLQEAIQGGLNRIYDQVRFWREGRFAGTSWFSTIAEYANQLSPVDDHKKNVKRPAPRILIVDDEVSTTRMLETCLKKQGCITTLATSGQDAIEKIMATSYDLVFLDWTMPDMTGGEALMQVEKLNSKNPSTDYQWSALRMPIITYSGHSRRDLRLPPCRHFRFIDHWEKSAPYAQLIHQTHGIVQSLRHDNELQAH